MNPDLNLLSPNLTFSWDLAQELEVAKRSSSATDSEAGSIDNSFKCEVFLDTSGNPTTLCLAAQAGKVEDVACLLGKDANIDQADSFSRTSLFLAVQLGHLSIVKLLLTHHADPTLCSKDQENILHAAAFYGHLEILKELLEYPSCKKLINSKDHDGKTPLHKALWGEPKPKIVELLLDHEADPNAKNSFDYTPLHWAAKHGHIESAQILIAYGAQIEATNKNGDQPFALAMRWREEEMVFFLLGSPKRLPKLEEALSKDLGADYDQRLHKAKSENLHEEVALHLEKISRRHIEKRDYVIAAKYVNSALAVLQKNKIHPTFQKYLFTQLEKIETLFLEEKKIKVSADSKGHIELYRERLHQIRERAREAHANQKPAHACLVDLTEEFKKLLQLLIMSSQVILGPPPIDRWACMGMGSMARDEMCPYSDLEFAFLIEENTQEAFEYFRLLSQFLELRVINLGETKHSLFTEGEELSVTPDGFSFDIAGNTPLGLLGVHSLIGTPEQLAQFQTWKCINGNIILSNAMSTVCWIIGDQNIIAEYCQEKDVVLEKNREKLAMKLLYGDIKQYTPNLSVQKEKLKAFGIKEELYRPFQGMLNSLGLFYNLESCSTFGRIDELVKKEIFSEDAGKNLKHALEFVFSLRLEAHLFYQDEKEFLLHLEEGKTQESHLLYLEKERLDALHNIYQVQIPFYECMKEFFASKSQEVFKDKTFYDDGPLAKAVVFERTLQFTHAHEALQQAVSLNPNSAYSLLLLASLERTLGNPVESLQRALQAHALCQKYDESHLSVAISYQSLSIAYFDMGQFNQALEFCEKILTIMAELQLFDENDPIAIPLYTHVSGIYGVLGDFNKALKFSEKALSIPGINKNNPQIANSYINIGGIYLELGEYNKALDFFEKALEIQALVLIENHPDIALSHNNIGMAYMKLSEFTKVFGHFKQAEKILLHCFDENHPKIALIYGNMGMLHREFGSYKKGLDCCEKSLKIQVHSLPKDHPKTAFNHNNVGLIYRDMGEFNKAFESLQIALKIQTHVFNENHPDIATSNNNIGLIYRDMGEFNKALEFFQKAAKINSHFFSGNHPIIAVCNNNIGEIYRFLGEFKKAREHIESALKIQFHSLPEKHPAIAQSYSSMGALDNSLGDHKMALEWYQKALKILLQSLSENHPNIADMYNNIGVLYKLLGEINKAREYLEKALNILNQSPSENHLAFAINYMNLGQIYEVQQEFQKAFDYYKEAEKIYLHVFGENHPKIALCYDRIGGFYRARGKFNEALEYLEKALKIRSHSLPENHPELVNNYNNIGILNENLGDYKKALEWCEKALKIQLQSLPENHPDIMHTYKNMGSIYQAQGDNNKAFKYFEMALKIQGHNLPENHPDLADSYNNIGRCHKAFGEFKKALELCERALEIRLKVFGENHCKVALSYYSLGNVYSDQREFKKALVSHHKALEIRVRVLGENHFDVASSHHNIGNVYYHLREFMKALVSHQSALRIWLECFGDNHAYVAASYNGIGMTHQALGEFHDALDSHQKALKILLNLYKENHSDISQTYHNISTVYGKLGESNKATEFFQKSFVIEFQLMQTSPAYLQKNLNLVSQIFRQTPLQAAPSLNHVEHAPAPLQLAFDPLFPCLENSKDGLIYQIPLGKMLFEGDNARRVKIDPLQGSCFQSAVSRLLQTKAAFVAENTYVKPLNTLLQVLQGLEACDALSSDYLTKKVEGYLSFMRSIYQPIGFEDYEISYALLEELQVSTHNLLAKDYGFKTSRWEPSQTIDDLLKILRESGPLIIAGHFGKVDDEERSIEEDQYRIAKKIHVWHREAHQASQSPLHFIILVGAIKVNSPTDGGGHLYFVDPNDPSDPENLEDDVLYRISYENLKRHAKQFEIMKGYAIYL